MSLTNPNKLINVQELAYFEGKVGDKYATKTALQTKANINHNHDTRYYTEAEVDALLADRTMHPIDMDEVTPSSTFTAGDVLGINGILYKAKVNTSDFPVTVVVDDTTGQFVYDTDADGNKAYVVEDYTLSEDWMKWADAGINYSLSVINSQLSYLNTLRIASRLGSLEASQSNILTALTQIQQALMPITVDGVTYSVRDILTELAKLMNANIVIDEGENQEDANSEE